MEKLGRDHQDAGAVMLERCLEHRGHRRVGHQRRGAHHGLRVLPPRFLHQDAVGKQAVCEPADLVSHGERRPGWWFLEVGRLVHQQPQPAQALPASHVAGLGEVRPAMTTNLRSARSLHNRSGPGSGRENVRF